MLSRWWQHQRQPVSRLTSASDETRTVLTVLRFGPHSKYSQYAHQWKGLVLESKIVKNTNSVSRTVLELEQFKVKNLKMHHQSQGVRREGRDECRQKIIVLCPQ